METLVERILALLRRDPSLALYEKPFPLKELVGEWFTWREKVQPRSCSAIGVRVRRLV